MRLHLFSIVILAALIAGCAHQFDEHVGSQAAEPAPAVEPHQVVEAPQAAEPPQVVEAPQEVKSHYLKPLSSPGAKFAALPPAVQNTIRAEVGVADIADIVKNTGSGTAVYEISFVNHDAFPVLLVAPNGDVLNPDLTVAVRAAQADLGTATVGQNTGIRLGDLPPNVMRAIQDRAPNAEVGSISKVIHGEATFYVVTFKDEAHAPKLIIGEDGTVLK